METITLVIWVAPRTSMIHLKKERSESQTSESTGYLPPAWAEEQKHAICYIQFQNLEAIVLFLQCATEIKFQVWWNSSNFWREFFERTFSLKLSAAEENGLCPAAKHHFYLNANMGSKEQNRSNILWLDNILMASINHQRDVVYEIMLWYKMDTIEWSIVIFLVWILASFLSMVMHQCEACI